MTAEVIHHKTREEWLAGRMETIGASELPALFGAHPYSTPFELFHIKAGLYNPDFARTEVNDFSIHLPPTERGNALEPLAMMLARQLRPTWTVVSNEIPGGKHFVDRQARMSCTPDAFIYDPDRKGVGALQIKSMEPFVFRKTWKPHGEVEPPIAVAIQAIVDAMLSGCDYAYVGAITAGFGIDFYLIEVDLRPGLMAKAIELVAEFWRRIEAKDPYAPDFGRDGDLVSSLWEPEGDDEIDLCGHVRMSSLLQERETLKAKEKEGEAANARRKTVVEPELLHILGNARRAKLEGGRALHVRTTSVPAKPMSFVRKAYSFPTFRLIEPKKGAAQ